MDLDFKGGSGEVGKSAFLINEELLMDYGIKPGEAPQYPLNGMRPKAVIVSHAHLDHGGAVPNMMDLNPDVFMTPPTYDLASMLARDTLKISSAHGIYAGYDSGDIQKFMQRTTKIDIGEEFKTHGYNVKFYDAGHIPGSAAIYIESEKGESLFYTGDINTEDTRLVAGAKEFPDADTLVLESTYFAEDHPDRKETEAAFIDSLTRTLDIGGTVLIPAFAIGRTQEIVMLLDEYGIHPYVDGMGVSVYKMLMKHPEYVKNPKTLERAFRNAFFVEGHSRRKVPLESSVIVTTAGMLNGGPVLYYLNKLHKDPKTKIMLTGYQVEGTNGRLAADNGIIENDGVVQHLKPKIEQYDFSAHCGDMELKAMVKDFCDRGTENVFAMHGDNTPEFAEWIKEEIGVNAYAPLNGERYVV